MKNDIKYLKRCLELAARGTGSVEPNPLVGAVIVKGGVIIGEGWHERFGGNHAEVNAFNNATEETSGATLYCNLEPCSHTNKKTPPCTPLIISKGIKKVVVCTTDPNPDVNGRGLALLEEAGIATSCGFLVEEAIKLNKEFFSRYGKD